MFRWKCCIFVGKNHCPAASSARELAFSSEAPKLDFRSYRRPVGPCCATGHLSLAEPGSTQFGLAWLANTSARPASAQAVSAGVNPVRPHPAWVDSPDFWGPGSEVFLANRSYTYVIIYYINTSVDPCMYMHGARRTEQRGAVYRVAESSTFE